MLKLVRVKFATIYKSADEVVRYIEPNSTILAGGFGLCGVPFSIINAMSRRSELRGLTVVSSNAGTDKYGISALLKNRQIKRMISSYVGENKLFEQLYNNGELELDITPQGTLAEKIRSGGYGIPIFATPTGVGTMREYGGFVIKYDSKGEAEIVSQSKPVYFDAKGKKYLFEESIKGDVAIIKAWKADKLGNLMYRKTARNFNQDMAKAAKFVIAEVEEIVEEDELIPEDIHTPCIYVNALIKTEEKFKPIEKLTNKNNMTATLDQMKDHKSRIRIKIAKRAAQDIKDGSFINLGIGIPTWVPMFLPEDKNVFFQAENGALGLNGFPNSGEEDADLIDPAKCTVSLRKGASFFSSSDSFGIIRGGHLDWTFLGAMEVSKNGDLANWIIPHKLVKGMGGAMDLVGSGSKIMTLMEHTTKENKPKILENCTLPITGKSCVNQIVTELAVFKIEHQIGLILTDIAEDTDIDKVKKLTGCKFELASDIRRF